MALSLPDLGQVSYITLSLRTRRVLRWQNTDLRTRMERVFFACYHLLLQMIVVRTHRCRIATLI